MKKMTTVAAVATLAVLALSGCSAQSAQERAEETAAEYISFYTGATDSAVETCEGEPLSASTDDLGESAHESTEKLESGDWEVKTDVGRADGTSYRMVTVTVKADGSCIIDAS